jgi:hypothetical protein
MRTEGRREGGYMLGTGTEAIQVYLLFEQAVILYKINRSFRIGEIMGDFFTLGNTHRIVF